MGYRILITEDSSVLAKSFIRRFEDYPYTLVVCQDGAVDWSDADAVASYVASKKINLVLNTSAVAQLHCESYTFIAQSIAGVCIEKSIPIIHLSSSLVFSDAENEPHLEASMPEPTTPLGKFLQVEECAVSAVEYHIILRLSWLIDPENGNFLSSACRSLVSSTPLAASDSKMGSPTSCEEAFRTVVAMIQQIFCGAENWGVFHLVSSDACVEAEFVDYLSRALVNAGADVGQYAAVGGDISFMPGHFNISGRRCTDNFGIQQRSWRLGIKGLVEKWLEKNNVLRRSS